jgi:hypothetical protein
MNKKDRQMRKKFLVISITLLLISLLMSLIGVVGAQEALDGATTNIQVEQQRRHVLGDGVADTPLEVDALQRGDNVVGDPREVHLK